VRDKGVPFKLETLTLEGPRRRLVRLREHNRAYPQTTGKFVLC
jgi:hypothetical protein